MFTEHQKDKVHFSSTFKSDYKAVYQEIIAILDENNIKHGLLEYTADYWCRDYMPLQVDANNFVQFHYHPNYLKNKRKYETKPEDVTRSFRKATGLEPLLVDDIVADGGNFTVCMTKHGDYVIVMTEKIFGEEQSLSSEDIVKKIEGSLNHWIVFLPWDKEDKCGHTDGIVHNIGDGRVLVNLEVYPDDIATEMRRRLDKEFEVVDLQLSHYDEDSWAYINMLQTKDIIIVPGLGIDTDKEALEQIKSLHPDYKDRIFMVDMSSVIREWDGALNCLTWTISTERVM